MQREWGIWNTRNLSGSSYKTPIIYAERSRCDVSHAGCNPTITILFCQLFFPVQLHVIIFQIYPEPPERSQLRDCRSCPVISHLFLIMAGSVINRSINSFGVTASDSVQIDCEGVRPREISRLISFLLELRFFKENLAFSIFFGEKKLLKWD